MVGLLGLSCIPVPFTRTQCWICNHLSCHGRVDLFDLFAQDLLDVGHRALTIHVGCKGPADGWFAWIKLYSGPFHPYAMLDMQPFVMPRAG